MLDDNTKEPDQNKAPPLHIFDGNGFQIAYKKLGEAGSPVIIWGHGWGHTHQNFLPLAESLAGSGQHIVLDFPGFGQSPLPFERIEDSWGSRDYAEAIAAFIRATFPGQRIIWVGHSFGCRVGTQLGAHHADLIQGMVYIAGAGLKHKRSLWERLVLRSKILVFKIGKQLRTLPVIGAILNKRSFGSADYQKAGPLRGTLVKVVNEHLTAEAAQISCPVLLIYGSNDTETPPEIGNAYKTLIKNAEMVHLPGQDHYTVLSEGRHAVASLIKTFVKSQTKDD